MHPLWFGSFGSDVSAVVSIRWPVSARTSRSESSRHASGTGFGAPGDGDAAVDDGAGLPPTTTMGSRGPLVSRRPMMQPDRSTTTAVATAQTRIHIGIIMDAGVKPVVNAGRQ